MPAQRLGDGPQEPGQRGEAADRGVVEGDGVAHGGAAHAERGHRLDDLVVLAVERVHLGGGAHLRLGRLQRRSEVPCRPSDGRGEHEARGGAQCHARPAQDRVAPHLLSREMVLGAAQQEEVHHHLLGGGIERHGLQAQLLRHLLDVQHAVLQLREVAQLRLDQPALARVHEDADLEAVVGAEVAQAVQVLPRARRLLGDHRAQALPFLQVDGRQAAELDLAVAEIRLAHRVARRERDEHRVGEVQVQLLEEHGAEDRRRVDAGERHAQLLHHLEPRAQQLRVGDGGVEHAVVAAPLGLAALQQRVAVRRVAEDLCQLAGEDRLAVARAHVRDRVEAEVLLGEIREEMRGHVPQVREVHLEGRRTRARDRELPPRHDVPALGDQAHQPRVREVDEVLHART